jgi:hypothetical protein
VSDAKVYTERDVLTFRRSTVRETIAYLWPDIKRCGPSGWPGVEHVVNTIAPLPKVTRQRVVEVSAGLAYRYVDGELQARTDRYEWNRSNIFTPDDIRALAAMLANPTEEVEA